MPRNPLAFQYLGDKAPFSVIVLTEKSLGILNQAKYLDSGLPLFLLIELNLSFADHLQVQFLSAGERT